MSRVGNRKPGTGAEQRESKTARPRVLIVITLAEVGGAGTYVAALLPALVERFEVAVAAHGDGPLKGAVEASGARFIALRHVRRPINPVRDAAGLVELVRLCRRERPDIIHVNSSKAGILGRIAGFLARVPIRIFTVHGWSFSAPGPTSVAYRVVERLIRPITTLVICVSEYDRRVGAAARACSSRSSIVIHNGINVRNASRADSAATTPLVIAVGRLSPQKNPAALVRSLAQVQSQFRAVIVGDGPDHEAVRLEIDRLGLADKVMLVGERADVSEFLRGADVFASSSRYEGLPIAVLEAMAAGLPVVAFAVGGVPELVVDETTGLLVPAGDEASLGAALERLLADASLRRRLGESGRARAERLFGLDAFRRAHVEAYESALASRNLAPRGPRAADAVPLASEASEASLARDPRRSARSVDEHE
jgi:glycosyltransferase involved in cell wall biosynthesis